MSALGGLSDEQRTARARSIGSTDSAAILGLYHPELAHLSKLKNAADVWMRLVHNIDLPSNSAMGRGIRVEPLLRALYRETVGPVADPPGTLRHPSHAWMVGSPDGVADAALVEFKTVGRWSAAQWGEPGTDRVPDGYNIQVQHLMEVAQRDVAHVLSAFGTDLKDDAGTEQFSVERTAVYLVHRDAALVAEIVRCGARFMAEHVEAKRCPDVKPLHNIRKWKGLLKQQPEVIEVANGK